MEGALRIATLWVVVFCSVTASPTLASNHAFTTFTSDDGLSQLVVTALLQDQRGYIWIGTQAGLDRFDGERFHSLGARDGLADDHVRALAEDAEGAIWVGAAAGLSRISGGEIHAFDAGRGLPSRDVLSLAADRDGSVWCGTSAGLVRWRAGDFDPSVHLPGVAIRDLLVSRGGVLWVASDAGLHRFSDGELVPASAAGASGIRALAEDSRGRLWLAGSGRVEAFDGDLPGERLELGPARSAGSMLALRITSRDEIWIGNEAGALRHYRGRTDHYGEAEGLDVIHVRAILEDREGILWLGGMGGLVRFLGRAFTVYTRDHGLPSSNVRPILRDRAGHLWVGTAAGVARQEESGWRSFTVEHGLPHRYVLSIEEDEEGRIWVGTSGGLSYFVGDRIERDPDWLHHATVGSLARDPAGGMWMAVSGFGPVHRTGERFATASVPGNTFSDPRLTLDDRGRVWASGDLGLSRWDGRTWSTFGKADGLAAATPYEMVDDGEGGLWLGYRSAVGLTHFDGRSFHTYTTSDGLSNDAVYSLGRDSYGDLWIGTARGVDRFDGRWFRQYGRVEGYPSWESNAGGFLLDHDGSLWFGTAEGLGHYDPTVDPELRAPLLLELRSFTFAGEPIGARDRGFAEGGSLEAEVGAITSINRKRLDLRYRLEGLGGGWQELRGERIEIPNLPAGVYTLEIRGRRYGEPWRTLRSPSFEIVPPLWRTPGFALMASLLLATALFGVVRLRTAHLERQTLLLEREVSRRTAETEAARRAAEAASRAKSEFLAHMSHEIRTPLNAIVGLTSVLRRGSLAPEQKHHVEAIEQSGQMLLSLIGDILDFSRIETGKLELETRDVDVRELLRSTLVLAEQDAAEKGLSLLLKVDEDVPRRLLCDPTRLRQIVWNLLGNAVKFTAEGFVEVRASRRREPDGPRLVIAVRDSGIGIRPDRAEAIFESFSQADTSTTREFGGTGLGLAIVKGLVDLAGGEIRVDSIPGEGAELTVTLPMSEAESEAGPETVPAELELGEGGAALEVLVVDDNPMNRLVAESILAVLGHRASLVDEGSEALSAIEGRPPDVILLDLHMPGMDGLETCRRIRRTHPPSSLPVLAVTADASEEARARCLDAGMNGVILKPMRLEALAKALADLGPGRAVPTDRG